MSVNGGSGRALDVLGIGFGPANLALAVALADTHPGLSAAFVERQPRFGWHRGMLLDGATMQISFLKDLVTLRDPTSRYSFLAYLHDRGRLVDFVNRKSFFPERTEFHDYLEWVAGRLDPPVDYGTEATGIGAGPVIDGVTWLRVRARRAGTVREYLTRSVVLGLGLRPRMPPGVRADDRVWHSEDLLTRLGTGPAAPRRFVVVGAGQSAAEATAYLHERYPAAEVCTVFARYGFSPADDTPFANRIFDPDAVDDYFGAPDEVKRALLDYHANTNYSVVDIDLIADLYRRAYREKASGRSRLRLLNASRVTGVRSVPDGVAVTVTHLPTGVTTTEPADAVVFATGYTPHDPTDLLDPDLAARCARDAAGRLVVGRDFRIATTGPRLHLYLQGGTEHSHGITSSLLSTTAVRAAEIADAVAEAAGPARPRVAVRVAVPRI